VNTTIPTYQSQLSSVADSLAQSLNTLQSNGVSPTGSREPHRVPEHRRMRGVPAVDLREQREPDDLHTGIRLAQSIAVNPTLLANPSLLATASGSATPGSAT